MRTRAVLALGVMLAATMTGCGEAAAGDPTVASAQSGPASANPSASTSTSEDPDAPLKFSQCMRENGMTWFPDPANGKMSIKVPKNVKKEDFDKAQQACRKYAPNGENGPAPSAADLEKVRQMAKCMRENGVPNFPDPGPKGEIAIDSKSGIDPESATFQAAEKKCQQYAPKGGRKEGGLNSENDGADS